jgi:poly-gamma-glutamate synthesis protein (capsule biosynthesis protein)
MKKLLLFFSLFILVLVLFIPKWKDSNYLEQITSEINIFQKSSIKILNFGDVMFDRGVRNIIENRKRDPFEYIKKDLNLIKGYDIFIVNLEGPIVVMDRGECQQKAYNFQFAPDSTERLKSVGINMVNIANNHSYDCFVAGFESTKKFLNEANIDYIGDSVLEKSFVIKEIADKKVAFVGIDETAQVIPLSRFYPLVKKLKAENDLVIVNIHWGTEYEIHSTENQRVIAHKLVDSGASVIFGHHPHVIEEVEAYKGKAIFYSLGNFVFDQNFGDTTVGLGVGVEFKENKTTFELFPFNMKVFAPDLMKGEEREKFCQKYLEAIEHNDCIFSVI